MDNQTSNSLHSVAGEIVHSKREALIDWSKALLIWLMVLGHAGLLLSHQVGFEILPSCIRQVMIYGTKQPK